MSEHGTGRCTTHPTHFLTNLCAGNLSHKALSRTPAIVLSPLHDFLSLSCDQMLDKKASEEERVVLAHSLRAQSLVTGKKPGYRRLRWSFMSEWTRKWRVLEPKSKADRRCFLHCELCSRTSCLGLFIERFECLSVEGRPRR